MRIAVNRRQLLWGAFSVLWVFAATAYCFASLRSDEDRNRQWANDLVAYLVEQAPELRHDSPASFRSQYPGIADAQLVRLLHQQYLASRPAYSVGFAQIDARYDALDDRPLLLARWLGISLGVPLLAGLIGFALGKSGKVIRP